MNWIENKVTTACYMGIFKKNGSIVWQGGKISNVIYDIKIIFFYKKHIKTREKNVK